MTLTPNSLRALTGIPDIEKIHRKKTALIMTGFQMEFFTGLLPVPDAYNLLERAVKIMDWADKNKIKTIHMPKTAKSPCQPRLCPEQRRRIFSSGTDSETKPSHVPEIRYQHLCRNHIARKPAGRRYRYFDFGRNDDTAVNYDFRP